MKAAKATVIAISQGLTRGFHPAWLSADILGFLTVLDSVGRLWAGESGIDSLPVRAPAVLPMHFPSYLFVGGISGENPEYWFQAEILARPVLMQMAKRPSGMHKSVFAIGCRYWR
jgi:hypothetical protein